MTFSVICIHHDVDTTDCETVRIWTCQGKEKWDCLQTQEVFLIYDGQLSETLTGESMFQDVQTTLELFININFKFSVIHFVNRPHLPSHLYLCHKSGDLACQICHIEKWMMKPFEKRTSTVFTQSNQGRKYAKRNYCGVYTKLAGPMVSIWLKVAENLSG